MKIIDQLHHKVLEKGPVCVGLDPRESLFPAYIAESSMGIGEKLVEFNKAIIEATKEHAACFKLQIACYEAFGLEGLGAYAETLKELRSQGILTIGDIKRGDILSTAQMYAKGHYEGDFEADFVTVNPYMGEDAISPYYDYMKSGKKGMFVLIRTSNKSSEDLQELMVEKEPLYIKTAKKVSQWGQDFVGESGYSAIGGVTGLTYVEEFLKIKEQAPNTFFLIPGYGAQGGGGQDAARVLGKELCGIINSSRGIIGAHKGKDEGKNFALHAKRAAMDMKEDITKWLR